MSDAFSAYGLISVQAYQKRTAAEELARLLSLRAKLELQYAADLEKLSTLDIDISNTGTIAEGLLALKRDLINKASNAKRLSENIRQDLVEPLAATLQSQRNELDKALYEPKHLDKERSQKLKAKTSTQARYFKSCSELAKLARKIETETSDFKRNKLLVKRMNLLQEQEASRQMYREAIADINKNLAETKAQAELAQTVVHGIDKQLFEEVKDVLRKLVVYETSWLRSVQYDIDSVATAMESINVTEDLAVVPKVAEFAVTEVGFEEFDGVLATAPAGLPYTVETGGKLMKRLKSWVGKVLPGPNKSGQKIASNVESIADSVWCNGSFDPEYRAVLSNLFASPVARDTVCSYLELRQESGCLVVPSASFAPLVQLIETLLSSIDAEADYVAFRRVLKLVSTLSKERDSLSEPRQFLREAVIGHDLWKNLVMWDTYAQDTVEREVRLAQNYSDSIDSWKNSVFCQLGQIIEVLQTFAIPRAIIVELVSKFGVRYELSDDDLNTLVYSVENSQVGVKKPIRGVPGWVHEIESIVPSRQLAERADNIDLLDFSQDIK